MKRDIERLRDDRYDLLVIGGGIYGAAAARAAALRNMKVALIERGDFGQATSANSLKVIHGGLRYLQHLDLKRMREAIRARRRLLQLAPHLVHPQSFVIPTYGHGLHGREAMAAALALNDLISWDRNRSVQLAKHIPAGRILTRKEGRCIMPGISEVKLTGAAQWYDCVVRNTERLTLSFILAAAELGARVANYVRAENYIVHRDTVTAIKATDCLTKDTFEIRARLIVDATGPWADSLATSLPGGGHPPAHTAWAKAVNLVIKHRLFGNHAVGIASRRQHTDPDAVMNKGDRYYFFIPWREGTLVGTSYKPYTGPPEDCKVERRDVTALVEEVNRIYPPAQLTSQDVSFWHTGLLPCAPEDGTTSSYVNLLKHEQILDYATVAGLEGLIAVRGVKYTTASTVADKVASLALAKLGRPVLSRLPDPPLPGGEEAVTGSLNLSAPDDPSSTHARILTHLKRQYGARHDVILNYARNDPRHMEPVSPELETIVAEVLHAVREEMAQTLRDVVLRRTELGTLAYPGDRAIKRCARIMARELGWDKQKTTNEIDEVKRMYDLPAE